MPKSGVGLSSSLRIVKWAKTLDYSLVTMLALSPFFTIHTLAIALTPERSPAVVFGAHVGKTLRDAMACGLTLESINRLESSSIKHLNRLSSSEYDKNRALRALDYAKQNSKLPSLLLNTQLCKESMEIAKKLNELEN